MKIRLTAFAAIVVAALGLYVLTVVRNSRALVSAQADQHGAPAGDSAIVVATPVVPLQTPSSNTGRIPANKAVTSGTPALFPDKVDTLQAMWSAANLEAQDYFGRVIDQNGKPIEGVTVTGTLMQITGMDNPTSKDTYLTQSDKDGNFAFHGLHGWHLAVTVRKDGFELGRNSGTYQPPNPQNKTTEGERGTFQMWRRSQVEPMVFARIHTYIKCDGTVTRFNLLTGKESETTGDLLVTITRTPLNIIRGQRFDWSAILSIPNGGLKEQVDIYPYQAPAEGYQPSIRIEMSAKSSNWRNDWAQSYYYTSANGKHYGRITLTINTNFQPPRVAFFADAFTNPNTSRNLQYDPKSRASEQ